MLMTVNSLVVSGAVATAGAINNTNLVPLYTVEHGKCFEKYTVVGERHMIHFSWSVMWWECLYNTHLVRLHNTRDSIK